MLSRWNECLTLNTLSRSSLQAWITPDVTDDLSIWSDDKDIVCVIADAVAVCYGDTEML